MMLDCLWFPSKYKEFTTEAILVFVASPMMSSSQVELIVHLLLQSTAEGVLLRYWHKSVLKV